MTVRKKLIEVALPLDAINAACKQDKDRKTGHIRNIHKWFAPMPLPSWRSMLFAATVDDPGEVYSGAQADAKRDELFSIIREAVGLDALRDRRLRSRVIDALRLHAGGPLPTVVDPFCGGGSTLVEAQRLGLAAVGSDINQIPVAISMALARVPQLFRAVEPLHLMQQTTFIGVSSCAGFLVDVRYYAALVEKRAKQALSAYYPENDDSSTTYAWRWSWSVRSPDPRANGGMVPLVTNWNMSAAKGSTWTIRPGIPDDQRLRFVVENSKGKGGNTSRSGASCIYTGSPIPWKYVRGEAKAGRMVPVMWAVAERLPSGERRYRPPVATDLALAACPNVELENDISLPERALGFRVQEYGFKTFGELFLPRQRLALGVFADGVANVHDEIREAAERSGRFPNDCRPLAEGGAGARGYADAVALMLGLCVGKLAQSNNVLVRWFIDPRSGGGKATPAFDRHAIPMVWDFVETNPFGGSVGDWLGPILDTALRAFELVETHGPPARVVQLDAREAYKLVDTPQTLVAMDPPYYANIGYADLSDFFYLWVRRALRRVAPDLFSTLATPKQVELIASPFRHGGDQSGANEYFRDGFSLTLERLAEKCGPTFPFLVVYALKQSEEDDDGTYSTGWEVFLEGLFASGLSVTATWPIRTTTDTRSIGRGTNALASAIFVVCRKRPDDAPTIDRTTFRRLLRQELPGALRHLQKGNIAPVDMAQASIGPGMAIFSRHAKVLEPDGSAMSVRTALQLINQALDEYLTEQEGEFDPETRFAVTWFETRAFDAGAYGEAETLAKARNVAVAGVAEAGILHSAGGKVRLLRRDELPQDYHRAKDKRPTVWEATQHLIQRLETKGEAGAAELLATLGTMAAPARDLAYRLYTTCERKKWAEEAHAYNGLVVSWPELEKLAAQTTASSGEPQMSLL